MISGFCLHLFFVAWAQECVWWTTWDRWGWHLASMMHPSLCHSWAYGVSLDALFLACCQNITFGTSAFSPALGKKQFKYFIFFFMVNDWFYWALPYELWPTVTCRKCGTPRPVWNAASQILMALGYIIMAMALPGSLHIGSILVGICYGVRLTITVPVASELFGVKYYGLLYNILILNLPLGSFLFSGLLAGYLYDAQATISVDGSNTCVGAHC